jgi:NhaA family Na+:H+ antiporter
MAFTWIAIRLRLASLPEAVNWQQLLGVAFLCGIGFTMSLFLGSLAFQEGGAGYSRADRLGIILGSLASGIVGYLILRRSLPGATASESPPVNTESGGHSKS